MKPTALDLDGLTKAFLDGERADREYILDTDSGRVHFVPVEYLKKAEKGKLRPDQLQGQARERAQIVAEYLDDIHGRFELVPFLDPEAEADWRAEFLAAKQAKAVTPELQLAWNVYKAERVQDEIGAWLEETGIVGDEDADEK